MFSLSPRTETEVLCLSVFGSFLFSVDLSCILELVSPPCQTPFSNPPGLCLSLAAFTVSGDAFQLRKCCETSYFTSCSNQYISGPADAHPQLRMHRHTCSFCLSHTHQVWFYTVCIEEGLLFNNLQQHDLILLLSLKLKETKVSKASMSFRFFSDLLSVFH